MASGGKFRMASKLATHCVQEGGQPPNYDEEETRLEAGKLQRANGHAWPRCELEVRIRYHRVGREYDMA